MLILTAGTIPYRIINGNEIQILLVLPQKGNGGYQIPKGHVDVGNEEPVQAAAVRETYEETGIQVNLEDYLGNARYPVPEGEKIVHAYLSSPVDPNSKLHGDGENRAIKWFDINKLTNINKQQAPLITKAVALIQHKLEKRLSV